jgi:hypothetical protein
VTPFTDPAWLAEVGEWIASQVNVTGELEQPHVRAWATALRVPTSDGMVWFKASREAFAFEVALLERLVPLAPGLLPEVLAARPGDGWLLLADAGDRAREHPVDWQPLLKRYAELQVATTALAEELIALGVVDARLPDPALLFEALAPTTADEFAERLPEIEAAFGRLADSPVPPMLDHGDLHDGNVFSRNGVARIIDWGDASVAHPFMTLTVEEDPAARDDYLEPFGEFAPRERLLADVEDVLLVRYVVRALNQLRIAPYDAQGAAQGAELRVRLFLDGES